MAEWHFAQSDPGDELAIVQYYSMKKRHSGGAVEFIIAVKEFAAPKEESMRFLASADKSVFQNGVPFHPAGWGNTLLKALGDCVRQIKEFPYQEVGMQ